MMPSLTSPLRVLLALALLASAPEARAAAGDPGATAVSDEQARAIAEEAFVYGYPLVMNYAIFYDYFVAEGGPDFKTTTNRIFHTGHVYTWQDTAIVTPNSDTPYSFVGMDLRAEPFVLCNPAIEDSRYFSIQLIDMYTFNYGYAGTRTTGNDAGCFLVAGPSWKGERPEGIEKVFRSETDFSIALVRTQLFDAGDLENVKKIQSGYRAMTLSAFLGGKATAPAPAIDWPKVDKAAVQADPFAYLNFVLSFCPPTGPAAVESGMRARFASIGIEAGKPFPPADLTPARKAALAEGIESGLAKIRAKIPTLGKLVNGWTVSTKAFGDRDMYAGDFLARAAAAMAGIYGNDAEEALYPMLAIDSAGQKPDTGKHSYTLTFPAGSLPPAKAFWSVTMYDGATQLLIRNPLDRYLLNSPMLPGMKKNADGSLTLHIRKDSPGKDLESNWLPAPDGPAYIVMRLYHPKPEALDGSWKPPVLQRLP